MMKVLALEAETPGSTAEQFAPHLKAEARHVWELTQAGVLREIYFRQDWPGAVLILECADADEAHDVLATLPLVQAGLNHLRDHPAAAILWSGAPVRR